MKEYFQYLIWMMIFVIVIEMFFPDSAYRKYIKLVLGCILIYTMLMPVIKLIQVDGQDYEGYVKKYQGILLGGEGAIDENYEEDLRRQQEGMSVIYEDSIKAYVEKEFEVRVKSVSVEWRDAALYQIDLTIGKSGKAAIGTIHIGNKSDTIDGDEEVLKNKIKTCLADFYNVQVGNIYITVQKN